MYDPMQGNPILELLLSGTNQELKAPDPTFLDKVKKFFSPNYGSQPSNFAKYRNTYLPETPTSPYDTVTKPSPNTSAPTKMGPQMDRTPMGGKTNDNQVIVNTQPDTEPDEVELNQLKEKNKTLKKKIDIAREKEKQKKYIQQQQKYGGGNPPTQQPTPQQPPGIYGGPSAVEGNQIGAAGMFQGNPNFLAPLAQSKYQSLFPSAGLGNPTAYNNFLRYLAENPNAVTPKAPDSEYQSGLTGINKFAGYNPTISPAGIADSQRSPLAALGLVPPAPTSTIPTTTPTAPSVTDQKKTPPSAADTSDLGAKLNATLQQIAAAPPNSRMAILQRVKDYIASLVQDSTYQSNLNTKQNQLNFPEAWGPHKDNFSGTFDHAKAYHVAKALEKLKTDDNVKYNSLINDPTNGPQLKAILKIYGLEP